MAMKTVICLSFIVLNNFLQTCVRAATRGEGEKGGGSPQNKTPPPKLPCQCRNFVIWGPGANIHYGAPFFSTKRSTGLLFTVQGSSRFFGVFRRLRAIETFQSSQLIFCNIARSYSNY